MAMSLFGTDPFGTSLFNDPFFADLFGFVQTPSTGRRRRRRRAAAASGTPVTPFYPFSTTLSQAQADPDTDLGHWHFDYHLNEPVQLELEEYAGHYIARIYHPGVAKEKLKLDAEFDTLIVSGEYEPTKEEKTEEKRQPMTRWQPRRLFKRFVRYMVLPDDVDQSKIEAAHKGEYLEVLIKKVEGAQQRQQRIPIK